MTVGAASLRAGTSRTPLPCGPGQPMMGYGAREGLASGEHDPLYARALYLEAGAGRALVVECDLCLFGVSQTAEVRDRIARDTGLSRAEILVGCIHTHSGPDSGLAAVLSGGESPTEARELMDAAARAGVDAVRSAAPAQLGAGACRAEIGRNRRRIDAPVDPDVQVLRVDRDDGSPLAVLYTLGCHPTVLGHDNLLYSADWPGAAATRIEKRLPGALALFVLGAHADVDPRTRGLLDLAIADQSVGETFEVMEELGREVGSAVAACALEIETRAEARIGAAVAPVPLSVHGAGSGPDAREDRLAERRRDALDAVGLPPDSPARTAELYRREREATAALAPAEVRERLSKVRLYLRDRTAPRIAAGERTDVEVQVMRLGPLWLLGLPLEITVEVGLDWRRRAPGEHASAVSIANGWLRYLPHGRHFDEPEAELRYEILQSTFEPDAAERLIACAETVAARLS